MSFHFYFDELFLFQLKIVEIPEVKNSKITAREVINVYTTDPYFSQSNYSVFGKEIENLKIAQSILSKQYNARSEEYNGIINLIYIFSYPHATSGEIDITLVNECVTQINSIFRFQMQVAKNLKPFYNLKYIFRVICMELTRRQRKYHFLRILQI